MSAPTLTPLPPRCREHRNYTAGCAVCGVYSRAYNERRRRLLAYGRIQAVAMVDAAPAIAHVKALMAGGMNAQQIAAASGLSWICIHKLGCGERRLVYPMTVRRVQAIRCEVAPACGAARRLQALATMGYGVLWLSQRLGINDSRVRWLRRGKSQSGHIDWATHRAIADLYDALLLDTGQSRLASARAVGLGWLPPEAWTEATIDDPAALPYGDPNAAEYVDEEQVRRAMLPAGHQQRARLVDLTWAEQRQVWDEWMAWRATQPTQPVDLAKRFRDQFRPVPAKLMIRLRALLEPAAPKIGVDR